jgi:uncharacterized membrane protein
MSAPAALHIGKPDWDKYGLVQGKHYQGAAIQGVLWGILISIFAAIAAIIVVEFLIDGGLFSNQKVVHVRMRRRAVQQEEDRDNDAIAGAIADF